MASTTFQHVSLKYAVKLLGCPISTFLGAAKTLNLKGRLVGGTRVWTRDEVEQIKQTLASK